MGAPISVFLADDHTMVREALAGMLSKEPDIQVVGQCGDGLKVVEMTRSARPDVIVLDVGMPGMNGLDICRQLTSRLPAAGVLILSMHNDEQIISTAFRNGARGFLLKEGAADQFPQAIRAVANGQTFLGNGVPRDALDLPYQTGQDLYDSLTTRERQVLQLIAEGRTNRDVAKRLQVSVKTVDTHRTHLMQKLGINDQTTLVKYALKKGLIQLK